MSYFTGLFNQKSYTILPKVLGHPLLMKGFVLMEIAKVVKPVH